jgi:hypothetical protein
MHKLLRRDKSGIQVDRADDGLQRVGQDRRPLLAARAHLTLTQPDTRRQAQLDGQLVQGVLLDQVGTHPRQVTFRQPTQLLVQQV